MTKAEHFFGDVFERERESAKKWGSLMWVPAFMGGLDSSDLMLERVEEQLAVQSEVSMYLACVLKLRVTTP